MKPLPRASTIQEEIALIEFEDRPRAIQCVLRSLAKSLNVDLQTATEAVKDVLKNAVRIRPAMAGILQKLNSIESP